MRKSLRKWSFFLLHLTGFILLYLVIRDLQWKRFIELLGTFPVWNYLAGFGVILLVYALKSLRWYLLNRVFGIRTSWGTALVYYLSAGFLSVVTPGRLGEFAKVYFLKRRFRIDLSSATSCVVMDRIWDVLVLSLAAGTSLVLLLTDPGWVMICCISLLILISLGMVLFPGILFFPVLLLLKRFPKIHRKTEELLELWNSKRSSQFITSLAITLLAFLMLAFLPVLFSASSPYPVRPMAGIGAISISNILSFLPVTIAGFGTRELVFAQIWDLQQYPKEIALSVATAYFMVTYLGSMLIGGAVYLFNLKKLYRPGEIMRSSS